MNIQPDLYTTIENADRTPAPADRKPRRDEYRGNPLLVLPMGENREFSFGAGKARTILAHLDAVIEFAFEHMESDPAGRDKVREAIYNAASKFAPLRSAAKK